MFESLSLVDTLLSYPGIIVFLMFSLLMALMLTGQRVFGVMGFIGVAFALVFIDRGALGYGFNAAIKLFNWYPMLTLPMFVFMGFMLSESGIANDMYYMFHVWFGGLLGGLAVGSGHNKGLVVLHVALVKWHNCGSHYLAAQRLHGRLGGRLQLLGDGSQCGQV